MNIGQVLTTILTNDAVIVALLGAVGTLAAGLTKLAIGYYKRLRNELTDTQAAMIERLAGIAAKWVEQTAAPGTPDHERLDRAVSWVVAQAHTRGIEVDPEFVTACVEAAVLGLTSAIATEPVAEPAG